MDTLPELCSSRSGSASSWSISSGGHAESAAK